MNSNNKILIAAGGTGGHIFPAYSLMRHFKEKKFDVKIITDKRGYRFLKHYQDADLKIVLSGTIIKKKPFKSIFSLIKMTICFFNVLAYMLLNRPKLVFGMGGYLSFPICLAAKVLRIPFIIYESNLLIGKANKYLLPFAKKMFVSYSELEGVDLKYKSKIIQIGNIIRKEILNYNNKNYTNNENKLNILILGGSQAAKIFAEILPSIFVSCSKNGISLEIYQQCLPDQNKKLEQLYNLNKIKFELFNFSNDILKIFEKINLVITRSGASITGELLNCKIPFISIPLRTSADEHQFKNAKYFEEKGYNFLIEEKDINTKLFTLIKSIHEDKSLIKQIVEKQKKHSDKLVFEKIDQKIKEIFYAKN